MADARQFRILATLVISLLVYTCPLWDENKLIANRIKL